MFETVSLRSELRFAGIDMGIRFKCKSCGVKYELPEAFAGKMGECVKCQKPIHIPAKSEIPPAPPGKSAMATSVSIKAAPALDIFQPDVLIRKVKHIGEVKSARIPHKEEDIVFRCRSCKQKYRLDKELAGRSAECSKCQIAMIIPFVSDGEFAAAPVGKTNGNNARAERIMPGGTPKHRPPVANDPNSTIYELDHTQPVQPKSGNKNLQDFDPMKK